MEYKLELTGESEGLHYENSLIFLDTNILLNLYKYSVESVREFFTILSTKHKDKVYITNQVRYEFFKNRNKEIQSVKNKYSSMVADDGEFYKAINQIDQSLSKIKKDNQTFLNSMNNYHKSKYHPFMSDSIISDIGKSKEIVDNFTSDFKSKIKKWYDGVVKNYNIEIQERISTLDTIDSEVLKFIDNCNNSVEINSADFNERIHEGKKRFELKIPPGFEDRGEYFKETNKNKTKEGIQQFGDYFIWREMLDVAKGRGLPCTFISDDKSSDWNDGDCPHPDLVREFYIYTRQQFWKTSFENAVFTLSHRYGFDDKSGDDFVRSSLRKEIIEKSYLDKIKKSQDAIKLIRDKVHDFTLGVIKSEYQAWSSNPDMFVSVDKVELISINDEIIRVHIESSFDVTYTVHDHVEYDEILDEIMGWGEESTVNFEGESSDILDIEYSIEAALTGDGELIKIINMKHIDEDFHYTYY